MCQRARREAARLPFTKCGGVRFISYPLCSLREGRVLRVGWERGHDLKGVLDLFLVGYRYVPAVQMNGTDELGSISQSRINAPYWWSNRSTGLSRTRQDRIEAWVLSSCRNG